MATNYEDRRLGFVFCLSFVFSADRNACHSPEVVIGILTGSVYKQIFLLVNKILPIVFAHFKIGGQLNGVRWAGFFAIATENTP